MDDLSESQILKSQLEAIESKVYLADSFDSAKSEMAQREYGCCIIHFRLDPKKGLGVCSWIRSESNLPIIMITSRDEPVDGHMALRAGASDYMLRPVENRILISRVTQQISRNKPLHDHNLTLLEFGPLKLDPSAHALLLVEKEIPLTNTEFLFLKLIMENPTQVFSKDQILDAIGVIRGVGSDHLVDTYASKLRRKIIESGGPNLIHAVRGVGFRLAEHI